MSTDTKTVRLLKHVEAEMPTETHLALLQYLRLANDELDSTHNI